MSSLCGIHTNIKIYTLDLQLKRTHILSLQRKYEVYKIRSCFNTKYSFVCHNKRHYAAEMA